MNHEITCNTFIKGTSTPVVPVMKEQEGNATALQRLWRPQYSHDLFRTGMLLALLQRLLSHIRKQTAQNLNMEVYDFKNLHFQANLCDVFCWRQKQHYYGDLVLGWAVGKRLPSRFQSKCWRNTDWAIYWLIAESLAELLLHTLFFYVHTSYSFD